MTSPSHRLLTLWFPDWPAECLRDDGSALVVFHRDRVVAATAPARAAGVSVGQRRRVATARCPEAATPARDRDHEHQRFAAVLDALCDLVPGVDIVDAGHVVLDIKGPAGYFGGENAVIDHLRNRILPGVVPAGVSSPAVGVGSTMVTSAVAALRSHRCGHPVVEPNADPQWRATVELAELIATGDVDADAADVLARVGVRTLGDIATIGVSAMSDRFGAMGARLHRLAVGDDHRRPVVTVPSEAPAVCRWFDPPVAETTPVVFMARDVVDELLSSPALHGRVCTGVLIEFGTEHAEISRRQWSHADGFPVTALVDRVRWQLDAWVRRPGAITAPIDRLSITVTDTAADAGAVQRLWGGRGTADDDAQRTVARLSSLLGPDKVLVAEWCGGRLTGERYAWVPATAALHADPERDCERVTPTDGVWAGAVVRPAPNTVPIAPIPVDVCDADGATVVVGGRGDLSAPPATVRLAGREHSVTCWAGPWPVTERWWEPRRRRLARVQVVFDDGTAHLLAVERRRWSLMGSYI